MMTASEAAKAAGWGTALGFGARAGRSAAWRKERTLSVEAMARARSTTMSGRRTSWGRRR